MRQTASEALCHSQASPAGWGSETITQSTQGILLEGLRLLDEANRDTEENVLEA